MNALLPRCFLTFVFLCVALLGAALYVAQRNHAEYLWLAILCVSAACGPRCARLLRPGPHPGWRLTGIVAMFAGYLFMVVTIEFVLRFTATKAAA